jgi:signal peptidase I
MSIGPASADCRSGEERGEQSPRPSVRCVELRDHGDARHCFARDTGGNLDRPRGAGGPTGRAPRSQLRAVPHRRAGYPVADTTSSSTRFAAPEQKRRPRDRGDKVIQVVRHRSASWLLLGVAAALLTTGCGTSSVDLSSHASAPVSAHVSTGSTPRTGQPQVYRVPTLSMEPTLPIGTRVVVKEGLPTVGAIVVYYPPEGSLREECGPNPHVLKPGGAACDAPIPAESKVKLIKRVVAGPGDEIYVQRGHVYRKASGSSQFVRENDSYIRACGISPKCDFPLPIKIPVGHWFLMGDNRGESDDSRFYGPVPTAWIVGVVTGIVSKPRF